MGLLSESNNLNHINSNCSHVVVLPAEAIDWTDSGYYKSFTHKQSM